MRFYLFIYFFLFAFTFENTVFAQQINDSTFVNIKSYSDDFVFDMKYATPDNFLKLAVYECAECYLRLATVRALLNANSAFMKLGYKIKFFDCYRPIDVQRKMWVLVSNPNYVANPANGSIHNRGAAVDITLVNKEGNELDMGTAFDFFGEASAHSYTKLNRKVSKNRKLLKKIMIKNNFNALDSEWWHYSLNVEKKYPISNFKWKCD
jgi:zinc D-Ala-D-Ala dipeptidase